MSNSCYVTDIGTVPDYSKASISSLYYTVLQRRYALESEFELFVEKKQLL